jgi:hypothetical protein
MLGICEEMPAKQISEARSPPNFCDAATTAFKPIRPVLDPPAHENIPILNGFELKIQPLGLTD